MNIDHDVFLVQHSFKIPKEHGRYVEYRELWQVAYEAVFPEKKNRRGGSFVFQYEDIKQAVPEFVIPKTVYGDDIDSTLLGISRKYNYSAQDQENVDKRALADLDIDENTSDEILNQITEYAEDSGFYRIYDRDLETNQRFSHYRLWKKVDVDKRLFQGRIAVCGFDRIKAQYWEEYGLSLPGYLLRDCTYSADSKKFEFGYDLKIMEINIKHSEKLVDYLDSRLAAWENK